MSEKNKKSQMPEGRRVVKSKSKRETLYGKRQELLEQMQSTEDETHLSVREQVEKLKSGKSSGSQLDEAAWGAKEKRKKGAPWMLWLILGLVVPILLVGLMLLTNDPARRVRSGDGGTGYDFDVLSGEGKVEPEDWFVAHSAQSYSKGLDTLETLNREDLTLPDIVPLVRSERQAQALLAMKEEGTWAGYDLRQPTEIDWEYGSSGEAGFMAFSGVKKDFRNFRAYFVREKDETKFDFDATEALSDVPIKDLTGQTLTGSVLLRCWLVKEPHFDARSDQTVFSWYQILAPNEVDFIWAYCRKGDPLDEALRRALNYGRLIGERKRKVRATVKVGNARGFRKDEFLFEELLAEEWVLPAVK